MKLLYVDVVVAPPLGDLEGVEVGSSEEDIGAFIVLLGLLALEFAPFLVELLCEVGMC